MPQVAKKFMPYKEQVEIKDNALTEALREFERTHDGSKERTEAIKVIREALEAGNGERDEIQCY